MKKYKKIVKEVNEFDCYECDHCKKPMKEPYESLVSCHEEWGNDSIDSYRNLEVCSYDCFLKVVSAFLNDYKPYSETAKLNDISYKVWMKLLHKGMD